MLAVRSTRRSAALAQPALAAQLPELWATLTAAPERCGGASGAPQDMQVRWASKKQGGSTQNRGGSLPKMLGIKLYGGQFCKPGSIIVRQRGTKVLPGANVGMGRDHTLFAKLPGWVVFQGRKKKTVSIEPMEMPLTLANLQKISHRLTPEQLKSFTWLAERV